MKAKKNIVCAKALIILATILACLLLLEIGLRVIGRTPTNIADGFFVQYKDSYRLMKNITKVTKYPSFTFVTYTNSLGFRDIKTGNREIGEKPYFTFLGASQTFANGVNYEQSFVGIFAKLAKKNGIEVLNLAFGGATLGQQQSLFKDFVKSVPHPPSKVIICTAPLALETFDKVKKDIVIKNGYLFKKSKWLVPYIKITLSNRLSAYCFFRDNIRRLQTKLFNKYIDNVPRYLEIYSKKNRLTDTNTAIKFENRLNEFENFLFKLKVKPIYVYLPLASSYRLHDLILKYGKNPENYDNLYYVNLMTKHCKKNGIQFINPRPILKTYHEENEHLRYKLDAHYTPLAHRVVGEYIYHELFMKE